MSPCLKKCIEPMAKVEKTISYLYQNYDDVCDTLEKSAHCAQKCSDQDHAMFFQYTTFYRVHCIEMEEGIHLFFPFLFDLIFSSWRSFDMLAWSILQGWFPWVFGFLQNVMFTFQFAVSNASQNKTKLQTKTKNRSNCASN